MLRRYLSEHVVINTEAVDKFATSMQSGIRSPESRAWIYKRARAAFLNNVEYLTQMAAHEVPKGAPGYVTQAMDRGETIYQFTTNSPSHAAIAALVTRFDHIKDFLRDIENWATRQPTENEVETNQIAVAKKWMSKIGRLTIEQSEQAAEEWARIAGSGTKALSKDGVVVLYQWPNGFYAVRYTDVNTCKRDGNDLQNCLRQGMYWNYVENGTQWIVSIRKANDEAVVGMRWKLPEPLEILECKGKNNLPVTAQYVPYVTELLSYFKVGNSNNNADLASAGIHMNRGQYGTFRDLAKHSLIDGVEYWVTDSRIEGQIEDAIVSCSMGAVKSEIGRINRGDASDAQLVKFLTNLPGNFTFSAEAQNNLTNYHLFQGVDGAWGSFEDIAQHSQKGGNDYWMGKGLIKAQGPEGVAYSLSVTGGNLFMLREWDGTGTNIGPDMLSILRNLPVPIKEVNTHVLRRLRESNIFHDATKGFGSAEDVGEEIQGVTPRAWFVDEKGGTRKNGSLVVEDEDETVHFEVEAGRVLDPEDHGLLDNQQLADHFVNIVNSAKLLFSKSGEDLILHYGYVDGPKGYVTIDKVGDIIGSVRRKARTEVEGDPVDVYAYTRGKSHIFLVQSGENDNSLGRPPWEGYRLDRGNLVAHFYQERGAYGLERPVGCLILSKYQANKTTGVAPEMIGGIETRYEKIVADPEHIISMLEALGDKVRLNLTEFAASSDYQDKLKEALAVNPIMSANKTMAARLYNALNPMKREGGPVKVKTSGGDTVYGQHFPHVYVEMATSLTEFEALWSKHPSINERYMKVLEATAAKAMKAINEAGLSKFFISTSVNIHSGNAYGIYKKVEDLGYTKNRAVRDAVEAAARNVPAEADPSSRFAALNTQRKLYR